MNDTTQATATPKTRILRIKKTEGGFLLQKTTRVMPAHVIADTVEGYPLLHANWSKRHVADIPFADGASLNDEIIPHVAAAFPDAVIIFDMGCWFYGQKNA